MLVDVVPLRRQGERLSNDEAKAAQPARGHLVQKTRHAINQFSETVRVVSATFEPLPGYEPLRELDRVVVSTIQGDSMMVTGVEIWESAQTSTSQHRQTWWCRLVPGSASA